MVYMWISVKKTRQFHTRKDVIDESVIVTAPSSFIATYTEQTYKTKIKFARNKI